MCIRVYIGDPMLGVSLFASSLCDVLGRPVLWITHIAVTVIV